MLANGPRNKVLGSCGYGNFSIPAAYGARIVPGLDGQNGAIRSAKHNVAAAGIPNCIFEKVHVPAGVQSLLNAGEMFDTILLNLPRQGHLI